MKNLQASSIYTMMAFVVAFAQSIMFTTYAVYQVIALGLSPFQLLLVGMVLEVTVLVFEGITGVMADLYSRRRSVLIGMFVLGTGFALEGGAIWLGEISPFFSAFVWLLVSQVVCGIGYTFMSGADAAWMVDEVGEDQAGRVFLRARRAGLCGSLLGIGLSIWISGLGANLPYVTGGILYVLLGLFLMESMKEKRFVRPAYSGGMTSHWREMRRTWVSGFRLVRRQRVLLLLLIVTVFSGAASEGYDRLWQAHLIHGIGLPDRLPLTAAAWFGLIAAASTLLGLLGVRIAEKRFDMSGKRSIFRGMMVLTVLRIAAILAIACSPSFAWAIAAVLLYNLAGTLLGPLYDTWLNLQLESKTRATVLSMMSQSDALGQTAGGPVVGWIGSSYSIRASLIAAAILLVPILALFRGSARQS